MAFSWRDLAGLAVSTSPYYLAPFTGGATLNPAYMAAAGAGGAAISGAGVQDSLISGGMGAMQGAAGLPGGGGAPTVTAGPGGFWSKLAGVAKNPAIQQAAGVGLTAVGEHMAGERENRRQSQGGDLQRLQTSDYLSSGGNAYKPKQGLPTYGFGPDKTSDVVREGAEKVQGDLIKRLAKGTAPSFWEQLTQIAGPTLALTGKARQSNPNSAEGQKPAASFDEGWR